MKKLFILPLICFVLFNFVAFYVGLPTISIHNPGMWFIAIVDVALILTAIAIKKKTPKFIGVSCVVCAVMILAFIVGLISSSKMFHASSYSKILDIKVTEQADLPSVKEIKQIPLMDTESSKMLGNRKIGALNEIVSQFEVSDSYATIAYKNAPVKVSGLIYADIWKWAANRSEGVPGYIIVYPNDLTADYISLSKGMKYIPSAYFSEDLARHIWSHYPTVFFDNIHMEIDESGKPYYVASTHEYTIGLFGGHKVTGCIVVDPVSGEMERYGLDNIPNWVDIVYHGDYIAEYFDIYGKLINGFWNSLFGQKGLIESTTTTTYDSEGSAVRSHDFGYLIRDNDVYVYTGVTAVTNDESNVGYLLANERTGEIKISYFESTDEDSVMRAAEGEVQEKGYRASFPSLIEIGGQPVYIMVLKDNLGLVKMYAVVDAAQYSHMAVQDTLEKAISAFGGDVSSEEEFKAKTVTLKRIELITIDGSSYVYLVDTDNNIYSSIFQPEMLLLEEGQTLEIMTDGKNFRLK